MGGFGKNLILWLAALLIVAALSDMFMGRSGSSRNEVAYSDFLSDVESGQVKEVRVSGSPARGLYIDGKYSDGSKFSSYVVGDGSLYDKLAKGKVKVSAAPDDTQVNSLLGMLINSLLPIIIMAAIWMFMMRQMQGNGSKAMSFGKSKARLLPEKTARVTFEDVAGIDEAKEELHEIVDFLKNPQKFQKLGGKIPKGCLLVGSPGTGKTLLARAIAGEANVPFFSISGSDFVEMFVGVGASRVRDMFEQGKRNAPCIIFIDEIDAVGRHRGAGLGGGNDEREQTLNQLLVEMDGFESNEGVIIIAATNRPDVLDPALLRPGRFDRQIVVPSPDIAGREKILKVHLKKVPLAPDVDAKIIARGTPGFSGADLANLVNEAALLAARSDKKVVTMRDLESAKDKVMMGAERRSMVMSDKEKELTAYHEAGHAIVTIHSPASDPIHKATIIPRGRALGLVMRLPEADRLSINIEKLKADLAVAMGGRVAEEMIFGPEKVTSGASSDIKSATGMARSMVTKWGMSDKIGPVFVADDEEDVFLGYSIAQRKSISAETANLIDSEVKRIVEEGYQKAKEILTTYNNELHLLAKALLEYETLSGDEIKEVITGKKPDRDSGDSAPVTPESEIKTSISRNKKRKNDEAEPQTQGA